MEERVRGLIEQIVGDASLTDELDDAQAQQLLAWGIAQARRLAQHTAEMETPRAEGYLEAQAQALRYLMRRINRLMGALSYADTPTLADRLRQIFEAANLVDGVTCDPPADLHSAAQQIAALPAEAALAQVMACLKVEAEAPAGEMSASAPTEAPHAPPPASAAPPEAPKRRPGAPPPSWEGNEQKE